MAHPTSSKEVITSKPNLLPKMYNGSIKEKAGGLSETQYGFIKQRSLLKR